MRALSHLDVDEEITEQVGQWRVWARRPGYEPVDVTWVRGTPTTIGEMTWGDPYGPLSATLTFPSLTMWDALGRGELWWAAEMVDFDIVWDGPVPVGYPYPSYRWEGYSMPIEFEGGVQLELIGAVLQLDNYLGKPEYPTQPFPYEVAIRRCWRDKPDLRLKPLKIEWPSWWSKTYQPKAGELAPYIPTGVAKGQKWTGLVTRETGSWDPLLTSYIQTLLSSMYTDRGRWTLDLDPGRVPVLRHREFLYDNAAATIVIDPLQPGVKPSLREDWTQSANVYYGQAKSLSGEAYSGLQMTGDGRPASYRPLAALRQVHPVTDRNTWLQQHRMRKESMLQLQDGLAADEAFKVGANHLQHFAEPGLTGTIVISSDVRLANGSPMHRALIRAGMSMQLPGFRGVEDGVLLHVVSASFDPGSGATTVQVDSKYRDRLTMDEVRLRGRDALAIPRMLIGGRYQPALPDRLFPWNYAEGSGYIPSSPTHSARRLFEDMPAGIEFPWTAWTTQRPPRSASWKNSYIRIGPKSANADKNWAAAPNRGAGFYGFPIRMAQAGQVRLLQLGAYDRDGNVLAVPFHFSLYYQRDVNVQSMPKIPAGKVPANSGYAVGQHHPFFSQAWETYNLNGSLVGTEVPVAVQSAGLIRGWGNSEMRGGHWPGNSAAGDPATGLLVDEEVWDFNLVGPTPHINQYAKGDVSPYAGYLYCMIYCDAQEDQEVFFLGRMYRVEPGSSV